MTDVTKLGRAGTMPGPAGTALISTPNVSALENCLEKYKNLLQTDNSEDIYVTLGPASGKFPNRKLKKSMVPVCPGFVTPVTDRGCLGTAYLELTIYGKLGLF